MVIQKLPSVAFSFVVKKPRKQCHQITTYFRLNIFKSNILEYTILNIVFWYYSIIAP